MACPDRSEWKFLLDKRRDPMAEHLERNGHPTNRVVLRVECLEDRWVLSANGLPFAAEVLSHAEDHGQLADRVQFSSPGDGNSFPGYLVANPFSFPAQGDNGGDGGNGNAYGHFKNQGGDSGGSANPPGSSAGNGNAGGPTPQGPGDGAGTPGQNGQGDGGKGDSPPPAGGPSKGGDNDSGGHGGGKKTHGGSSGSHSHPSPGGNPGTGTSGGSIGPKQDPGSVDDNPGIALTVALGVESDYRVAKTDDLPGDVLASDGPSETAVVKATAADDAPAGAPGAGLAAGAKLTAANVVSPANAARGLAPVSPSDNPAVAAAGQGDERAEAASAEFQPDEADAEEEAPAPAAAPAPDETLADFIPAASAALDQAVEKLLGQVNELGREIGRAVQGVGAAPWVATILLVSAALELTRRRRTQPHLGLAGTGNDLTLTWVTGLPGTFRGRMR
jgi:hypothetical protein